MGRGDGVLNKERARYKVVKKVTGGIVKDIGEMSVNQAVKLLPKKIGDRGLVFTPGCAGQIFDAYYKGKSGFGPISWNYTLGKAIRALLRLIKCSNCGAVVDEDQECGIPDTWQVSGEQYNSKVFCSKRCKVEFNLHIEI